MVLPDLLANGNTQNADCGVANGQLGFKVSGGLAPYAYTVYSAAGTQMVPNSPVPITGNLTVGGGLTAGCYTLILTDANGCKDIEEVCLDPKSNNLYCI